MIDESVQNPDECRKMDEDENKGQNLDKKICEGEDSVQLEKIEELKLISKFPQTKKAPVGSQFLQKRLQQRKFFDSGDYNMAKAKALKLPVTNAQQKCVADVQAAGQEVRATQPSPTALRVSVGDRRTESSSPTGMEIPTPETVPLRKTSIVVTSGSKLSPQPLLHHSPTGSHPLPGSMDVCQV